MGSTKKIQIISFRLILFFGKILLSVTYLMFFHFFNDIKYLS